MSATQDTQRLRKITVFEPCERHEAMYASEMRYRRAEAMAEGGWCSPCRGRKCRMKPGADFYCASFVAENPVYEVENDYGVERNA